MSISKIFLLIDDDLDDAELFLEAVNNTDKNLSGVHYKNGNKALEFLKETNQKPAIIFLDINMPEMDGWQCLSALKKTESLRNIPVIIYSTSSHKRDITLSKELGVLCFLTKPDNFIHLEKIIHQIFQSLDKNLLEELVSFTINDEKVFYC